MKNNNSQHTYFIHILESQVRLAGVYIIFGLRIISLFAIFLRLIHANSYFVMLKYFVDKQYSMTTGNEVNDVNSPVQTQESEMGDAELQVDTNRVDAGEKSDESSTNVAASFSCEECGKTFATRQELKEHTQVH